MSYKVRKKLIKELQNLRKSRIVSNIYSDRRVPPGIPRLAGLTARMATEAQPFFYRALQDVGKSDKLELYLYTLGGQLDSVWPLVSLFREFGDNFNVLVPFKAHSAGTLVCLGANQVVLGDAAELSPVDPSTGNQFNPVDEIDKSSRKEISVEDVSSYFALARDPGKRGLQSSGRDYVNTETAFTILAEKVHPLALGNVNRSHIQIRQVATRLLKLHRNTRNHRERKQVDRIVKRLTEERYSHADVLNRKEVAELLCDNMTVFASEDEQIIMWKLFEEYAKAMKLWETFILASEIGDNQSAQVPLVGAFIESEESSYIFKAISEVNLTSKFPPNVQINLQKGEKPPLIPGYPVQVEVKLLQQGWFENTEGI